MPTAPQDRLMVQLSARLRAGFRFDADVRCDSAVPFGSTQTPSEVTFLTARGTSFAPPSRAALERAAKLLGSVLSDDEAEVDGPIKTVSVKGKGKARVPFGLLEGENGEGPAPDASGLRQLSAESAAAPRPPPSATLLPDRRRLGAANIPSGPIPLPPPLSQGGGPAQQPLAAPPPPATLAAPRPRPALPSYIASTPSRRASHTSFASPGPSYSVRQATSLAGGLNAGGASTPLRRIGISLGTTPRAATPGSGGGTPSGTGTGRRTRKAFATPFKKEVAPASVPAVGEPVAVLPGSSAVPPGSAARPIELNAVAGPSTPAAPSGNRPVSVAGTPLRAGITGDRRQTATPSRTVRRPSGAARPLRSDYPAVFDLTRTLRSKSRLDREARTLTQPPPYLPLQPRQIVCRCGRRTSGPSSMPRKSCRSMACAFALVVQLRQGLPADAFGLCCRPDEVAVINLTNARFYFFTATDSDDVGGIAADGRVSWEAAHTTLVRLGCSRLAPAAPTSSSSSGGKQADTGLAWVENHWSLILWKLACLCRAKPEYFFKLPSLADKRADDGDSGADGGSLRRRESDSDGDEVGRDRWRKGFQSGIEGESGRGKFGWAEMIRQLLYRCARPPHRTLPGSTR
jgi:hypothetical protein